VELVDETDMSPLRIDARLALAWWLQAQGSDETARVAREAIELADAKGARAMGDKARRFLSERSG
jgi:hypothetical protein